MAALIIAPQPRVLIVEQGRVALGKRPDFDGPPTRGNVRVSEALKRHPEDVALHLASRIVRQTVQDSTDPHFPDASRERWIGVHALLETYPGSALIAAASLRTAMPNLINLRSDGDNSRTAPTDPRDAALFDQDAALGERIDPKNAYFPLMRAVGLYATGHEREAVAAVLRAGTKSDWREYFPDEVQGRWRLAEIANGGTLDVLNRADISASILLPHYSSLRELSRRLVALAIRDEQAGQTAQGIALRQALMRCGGLMRAQSTATIGSLVGIAIIRLAMKEPGGTPDPVLPEPPATYDWWARLRFPRYQAFLTRNGRGDEVRWIKKEVAADNQVNRIFSQGINSPHYVANILFTHLLPLLLSGMLVLMNTLWIFLIGGIASLVLWMRARRTGNEARRAFVPPSAFAVAGVLGLAGLTAGPQFAGSAGQSGLYSDTIFMTTFTALIVSVAALMIFAVRTRMSLGEGARVFLVGLGIVAVAVLALLFASQQTLSAEALLTSGGAFIGDETAGYKYGALIFAAPFALVVVIAVVTLVRRVPFTLGLARGFAALWLPVTMLLVMGYAGVLVATIRQETEITKALTFQVTDEGQYLASLEGVFWPGVVPEEPAPATTKAVDAAP